MSFVFLVLISMLGLGSHRVFADNETPDFWSDYGEADKKNATYAPGMDKEINRKTRVEVVTLEKSKVFVADEYLQLRYLIRVPFDVRIDEKKLPQELMPFKIAGFHFGKRRAIKNDRDIELQELLLTLRLNDPSFPNDTYVLPSFDLHYQYDAIVGNSRILQERIIATEEIFLEKVPVYVRVQQQRDTGFLWDTIPCFLEIHTDNSVVFLNLDQNIEVDTLMQFKPVYPFVLQGQTKSEFSSDHYRVIRYEFMVAVQNFRSQPFTLKFPQIAWQHEGASPESKNVITPEAPVFFIQQITTDSTRLNSMRKLIPEPLDERYRLLDLPFQILWTIMTLGLFWLTFLFWQYHKQKQDGKVPRISKPVQPVFDKWPWQRLVLGLLVLKARFEFKKNPGQKSCAYLRELLARNSALRLPAKLKVTVAEACALTAYEIAQLGGRKQDITELIQLEHHLQSGTYDKMKDNSQEGEK
jgi:hypothetical protein